MNVKNQYLISCDYGEYDDARSIPILIVPTFTLAKSICTELVTTPDSPYRQFALDALGENVLPPDVTFSIKDVPTLDEEEKRTSKPLLTKKELRQKLKDGALMGDLFEFKPGQECEIFKADKFAAGSYILYIPDVWLNDIPLDMPISDSKQQLESILNSCYTGDDIIQDCGGNVELAERLFYYCDWQHPSSALPELDDSED